MISLNSRFLSLSLSFFEEAAARQPRCQYNSACAARCSSGVFILNRHHDAYADTAHPRGRHARITEISVSFIVKWPLVAGWSLPRPGAGTQTLSRAHRPNEKRPSLTTCLSASLLDDYCAALAAPSNSFSPAEWPSHALPISLAVITESLIASSANGS